MTNNELNKNNMSVYIAFHINEELETNKHVASLKKCMSDYFGSSQKLEISSDEGFKREFIFKVQQPLLLSESTLADFFEKLEKVFNINSDFSPHFTQLSNHGSKRGNK